jgi:hypothetical protein
MVPFELGEWSLLQGGNKSRLATFTPAVSFNGGWDRQMSRDGKADVYRVHAAQCIQLAQMSDDPESNAMLLNMAQSWRALADQNDKNSRTALVYETPEPRQQAAQQQQQPQPKKQ